MKLEQSGTYCNSCKAQSTVAHNYDTKKRKIRHKLAHDTTLTQHKTAPQ